MTVRGRSSLQIQLSRALSGLRSGLDIIARVGEVARQHHARQLRRAELDERGGAPVEFLWRHASPMEQLADRWVPHRIVRRTSRALLVEAAPYKPGAQQSNRRTHERVRTYWVDRSELERNGLARARSRKTVFFTSPRVSDHVVRVIESLNRLGLWWPFTENELRQVYRQKALQAHPDAGGSEERFVQLQKDYQRALAALELGQETRD